jgi:ApaG protein
MYTAVTEDIHVFVQCFFLEEHSDLHQGHYLWAYQVRIENHGKETVQLLTRHWQIYDAEGNCERVNGKGVTGEQPILEPGSTFEYTSGVPLRTPSGMMQGIYSMGTSHGKEIFVKIPAFSLDSPHQKINLN